MKSDDICDEFAEKQAKLTVRLLEGNDVLIEGDSTALEFLGNLLLAHASEEDCGRHIGPHTAGSAFFSSESTKGIYIHRVPCGHSEKDLSL